MHRPVSTAIYRQLSVEWTTRNRLAELTVWSTAWQRFSTSISRPQKET
jgi:hypothetical protein